MAAAVEAGVVVELGALDLRHARLRLRRPEDVAAMKRSVERHGVLQPLVGNQEGEHLVLLDGFKRRAALEALGRSQAPVRVVRLSVRIVAHLPERCRRRWCLRTPSGRSRTTPRSS